MDWERSGHPILWPEPLSQHVHNELPSAVMKAEDNQNQFLENISKDSVSPSFCTPRPPYPTPLSFLLLSPLLSSAPLCSPLLRSERPCDCQQCVWGPGWGPTRQRAPLSWLGGAALQCSGGEKTHPGYALGTGYSAQGWATGGEPSKLFGSSMRSNDAL